MRTRAGRWGAAKVVGVLVLTGAMLLAVGARTISAQQGGATRPDGAAATSTGAGKAGGGGAVARGKYLVMPIACPRSPARSGAAACA